LHPAQIHRYGPHTTVSLFPHLNENRCLRNPFELPTLQSLRILNLRSTRESYISSGFCTSFLGLKASADRVHFKRTALC
jgi:hypothetical protein